MTSGNHIWDRKEIYDYIGETKRLIRPANYPEGDSGFRERCRTRVRAA